MQTKHMLGIAAALCLFTGCSKIDTVSAPGTQPLVPDKTLAATQTTSAQHTPAAPPDGVILTGKEQLEVHTEIKLDEFIDTANVTIENGNTLVDTSKTGTFELAVPFQYQNHSYEQTLSYTVVDTTPPVLLNGGSGSVIQRGDSFDLNDYVGFGDNYDAAPTLTYTGQVDTASAGDYDLAAVVSDAAGNQTSWELTITVADEIPVPVDNNERITFDTFAAQYGGDNVRLGIDVSKWQGDIDFEAVKAAGCSYVIMRIASFYDEMAMDSYYQANMSAAKAAGLDVGVYFYTTDHDANTLREHAAWIAEQLDGQELDFPVVFDWESFSNYQQYNMSIHELNELFEVFAEEMEGYGYSAMLYSSKNFLNNFWYAHETHPIWLAHYTDETDYDGDYVMWQATSCGRIDGIAGDVDFNILYTDRFFS